MSDRVMDMLIVLLRLEYPYKGTSVAMWLSPLDSF